mgnify:CR=1 FL=1
MPFLETADTRIEMLPRRDPERIVLQFLRNHAVGHASAKPWRVLSAHLERRGIYMTQQAFQQGILKRTRESNIFIGSNDHGRSRGYYLFADIADAEVMRDWYAKRISTECARLRNLRRQAAAAGWKI